MCLIKIVRLQAISSFRNKIKKDKNLINVCLNNCLGICILH
jgi:hypothetical protein